MSQQKNHDGGFAHLWILVIAVLVVVGGTGYYVWQRQSDKSSLTATSAAADSEALPATLPGGLLATDNIKKLAQTENPGSALSNVELRSENGTLVYEAKFADGASLLLNAKTGKIIARDSHAADKKDSKSPVVPFSFTAGISFAEAAKIAQAQQPNSVIQKISLEDEDGAVVYSVRFKSGARVDINAATGAIVKSQAAKTAKDSEDDEDSSDDKVTSTSGRSGSNKSSTAPSSDDSSTSSGSTSASGSSGSDSGSGGSSGSGRSGSGRSGSSDN